MTSTHLRAFHEEPPSLAHGAHFWPSGQSCTHGSHSLSPGSEVLPWQSRKLQPFEVSEVEPPPPEVVGSDDVLASEALALVLESEPPDVGVLPEVVPLLVPVSPGESGPQARARQRARAEVLRMARWRNGIGCAPWGVGL